MIPTPFARLKLPLATALCVLTVASCSHDSPVQSSLPAMAAWVKESGTLTDSRLNTAWASPSGSIFMGASDGSVFRFDGHVWTATSSMPPRSFVYQLWGFSDRNIYAATGGVSHFDGVSWKREAVNTRIGSVLAVWGTDSAHMIGVGTNGAIFQRVNGTWETTQGPSTRHLLGVWGSNWNHVFAVGDLGRIIEFNGQSWQNVESGVDFRLYSVWGRSSSDVYAVGDRAVTHFDGHSWEPIVTSNQESFTGVWGDADATYFVGAGGSIYRYRDLRAEVVYKATVGLQAIAGAPGTGIVAGGANGVTVVRSLGGWQSTADDASTLYISAHVALDGTLFVTGYDRRGSFVRSRGPGQAWTERAPTSMYASSIWAADHDHAYVLAGDGVRHLVLSNWDLISTPDLEYPRLLTGFDADHIVVIEDSTASWFDGSTWTRATIGEGVNATDVCALSANKAYVAGGTGRLFSWDGSSWHLMRQFDTGLYAVAGTSGADLWVVAGNEVEHFNGIDWEPQLSEFGYGWYYKVLAVSSDDVFMLSYPSVIAHFDGLRWSIENTPPSPELTDIAGAPGTPVVAVGRDAAFLRLDR